MKSVVGLARPVVLLLPDSLPAETIPGCALIRSLTRQVAGAAVENVWKPAWVQTGEGLIPAFIIEEFEDGRHTVFNPSIPTPPAVARLAALSRSSLQG